MLEVIFGTKPFMSWRNLRRQHFDQLSQVCSLALRLLLTFDEHFRRGGERGPERKRERESEQAIEEGSCTGSISDIIFLDRVR